MRHPAGSRPGIRNFESDPAMRPSTIQWSQRGMLERNADRGAHACRDIGLVVVSSHREYVGVAPGINSAPVTHSASFVRLSISMPYIQLDGQQYPLIAGGNAVGGNEGARIRLAG